MATRKQFSFAGGELDPALHARTDIVKYATGAKTIRNFFIHRSGGLKNRPGTVFVGEVKDSSATVRLIPFVFNSSQTYMLEFGNQYMRVMKNRAYVTDLTLTITGISNANPGVVTYTGTDPANGDEVYISGVAGTLGLYLNNRNFKVANVNTGANTFELTTLSGSNFTTVGLGTYTSGGTASRIYTLTTSFTTAMLEELQYVQSADEMTLTHRSLAPQALTRSGDASWSITAMSAALPIGPVQTLANSASGGATSWRWAVTAVTADEASYEESVKTETSTSVGPASLSTTPVSLSWAAPATGTPIYYNVYRRQDASNGIFGLIGSVAAESTGFTDNGYTPDFEKQPSPAASFPFTASNARPAIAAYYQQRLVFGNTNNNTEGIWCSKIGSFSNYATGVPLEDNDPVIFSILSRRVSEIRALVDLGRLVVFTEDGEHVLNGSASGKLSPTEVNKTQHSYYGAKLLKPIIIGASAIFVQARTSIVRDLGFDANTEGYRGNDLTAFSTHLFDNHSIDDWAYQQTPNSLVFAVRDDGDVLCMTYLREQEIAGWSRFDTDGTIEQVAVIPSTQYNEDEVYFVVNRTINGATKRYVEYMETRNIDDSLAFSAGIKDMVYMDSALTYDGRNTAATTMTLSGGTDWDDEDLLTLTSSAANTFLSTDVGNAVQLFVVDDDGNVSDVVRCTIASYTSDTVVSVYPHKTVPASLRSTATTYWADAVDQVTGLWHLEGKDVAVFADGFVVGSPNNAAYDTYTVTNGSITLDQPYGVIQVGLPYLCDIETLNIDNQQGTIIDKAKLMTAVSIQVEKTRGLWLGPKPPTDDSDDPLENLEELKIRDAEDYDSPVDLATGIVDIDLRPEWNSNGRIFLRQTEPIPCAILSIAPAGWLPGQSAVSGRRR